MTSTHESEDGRSKEESGPSGIVMPDRCADDDGLVEHVRRSHSYGPVSIGIFAGAAVGYLFGMTFVGLMVGACLGFAYEAGSKKDN